MERGIPRVTKGGVKLLGAPVGSQVFEMEILVDRIAKLEALLEKLPTLEDPHTEYVLLKNCFGLPKLSYTMRTVDPRPHQNTLKRFDTGVRQALERELGVSLEDHQYFQATLPVSMGGLGVRRVETHSPGAYIASLGASSDIMEEIVGRRVEMETKVVGLVNLINTLSGDGELTPEGALASTQHAISQTLDQHQVKLLQEGLSEVREKARVNSVGMLRAGDWLNAAPVRSRWSSPWQRSGGCSASIR